MHPNVERLIKNNYDAQKSDAWLALRNTMLTASDAATAIGDNPYETPTKLILKKCGYYPFNGNEATRHGEKYEDEARDIYCEKYGEVSHEIGLVQHPKYPWLGGSPDGICESGKLIEIKCPMRRAITKGEIPHHYMAQIQLLMDIMELEECDFIEYKPHDLMWPQPAEFQVVNIKRDRKWFEEKMPIMKEVWDKVLWHREHGCDGILPKTRKKRKSPPPPVCEVTKF